MACGSICFVALHCTNGCIMNYKCIIINRYLQTHQLIVVNNAEVTPRAVCLSSPLLWVKAGSSLWRRRLESLHAATGMYYLTVWGWCRSHKLVDDSQPEVHRIPNFVIFCMSLLWIMNIKHKAQHKILLYNVIFECNPSSFHPKLKILLIDSYCLGTTSVYSSWRIRIIYLCFYLQGELL